MTVRGVRSGRRLLFYDLDEKSDAELPIDERRRAHAVRRNTGPKHQPLDADGRDEDQSADVVPAREVEHDIQKIQRRPGERENATFARFAHAQGEPAELPNAG